jgi:hypothetical protein
VELSYPPLKRAEDIDPRVGVVVDLARQDRAGHRFQQIIFGTASANVLLP